MRGSCFVALQGVSGPISSIGSESWGLPRPGTGWTTLLYQEEGGGTLIVIVLTSCVFPRIESSSMEALYRVHSYT